MPRNPASTRARVAVLRNPIVNCTVSRQLFWETVGSAQRFSDPKNPLCGQEVAAVLGSGALALVLLQTICSSCVRIQEAETSFLIARAKPLSCSEIAKVRPPERVFAASQHLLQIGIHCPSRNHPLLSDVHSSDSCSANFSKRAILSPLKLIILLPVAFFNGRLESATAH